MGSNSKQAHSEVVTFQRFAKVCPLDIDIESIENRNPPEPDISCTLSGSQELAAFELVEIIDEDWARILSGMFADTSLIRRSYEAADGDLREKLDARLGNALVYVKFKRDATSRLRKESVPALLTWLSELQPEYQGRWLPTAGSALAESTRWISVSRGQFVGPIFDVDAASSVGDPTLDRISTKWAKKYATNRPIDLLAFYELQSVLPEGFWKQRLDSFLAGKWQRGPFRRLWLFDVGSASILYRADRSRYDGAA